MMLCGISFLMSAAMMILAVVMGQKHGGIGMPVIAIGVISVLIMILSAFGFLGTMWRNNTILLIYFYTILVATLSLVLFSIGALAFTDEVNRFVEMNWDKGEQVRSYMPIYIQAMNYTAAVKAAEEYIQADFRVVGAVGCTIICILFGSLYNAIKVISPPVIMRHLL